MSDERLLARLDNLLDQMRTFDEQLSDPTVVSDHKQVAQLGRKRAAIEPVCTLYQAYCDACAEADDLRQMLKDDDKDVREMAKEELVNVEDRTDDLLEKIKGDLVTADDRAVGSVILEIRAGVGGNEAAIWAGNLLEMYERYAAAQKWK